MPTHHDQVLSLLDQLARRTVPHVAGAAAINADGLVLAAHMADTVNVGRVGIVAATMIGLTRGLSADLQRGALDEVILRSGERMFMVLPAGEGHLLALDLCPDADLAQVRRQAQDAAGQLRQLR